MMTDTLNSTHEHLTYFCTCILMEILHTNIAKMIVRENKVDMIHQ